MEGRETYDFEAHQFFLGHAEGTELAGARRYVLGGLGAAVQAGLVVWQDAGEEVRAGPVRSGGNEAGKEVHGQLGEAGIEIPG
jgi:hypothetical protein